MSVSVPIFLPIWAMQFRGVVPCSVSCPGVKPWHVKCAGSINTYFSWIILSYMGMIVSMSWRLTQEWTVHCCERSLESSPWDASIRAEVQPERGARWYDSAGSGKATTEFLQQPTWSRRAVVNPQIVGVLLCVEVRKHHLDRVATWHCDTPVTVLVVGVILRVGRAPESTRVLPTDGRWATCRQSICASARRITNRSNHT